MQVLLTIFMLAIFTSDINECDEGSHDCDENANCTNTEGSFFCTCNAGYSGDGTFCEGMFSFSTDYLHYRTHSASNLHFNHPILNHLVFSCSHSHSMVGGPLLLFQIATTMSHNFLCQHHKKTMRSMFQ